MILLLLRNFTPWRREVKPRSSGAAARLAMATLSLIGAVGNACSAPELPYRIIAEHPHDPTHFTQGLSIEQGRLYESTGRYGSSAVYEKRLRGSEVLRRRELPERFFGEGLTVHQGRIIQLTWREGTGFVYDPTLRLRSTFRYAGEGWGIAVLPLEATTLAVSDGTAVLRLLHPQRFTEVGRLWVTDEGKPISRLNELEYAHGLLYANVWYDDRIAAIDPGNGNVRGWLNLADLRQRMALPPELAGERVLNGIAYDAASGHLFVTGKCWPRMFELAVQSPVADSPEKEKPRP